MNDIKKIILCSALIIRGVLLHSQSSQELVIQTPNAASLGVFGSIPVNYYTGTPDISIPLYTLKAGKITVPINLRYHPGSVKPNEHPGWVGLGWNLQSYGTITRVQHGEVDEYNHHDNYPSYFNKGKNLLNESNWDSTDKLKEYFEFRAANDLSYPDADADEFYFSFMEYSGKFIYTYQGWKVDSEHNIKVEFDEINGFISKDSVQIKLEEENEYLGLSINHYSRMFKTFTLVTDDGTKYIFGGDKAIEYSTIYSDNINDPLIANTWYLKEIVDTDNNTVRFNYKRGLPICKLSFISFYNVMECHGYANGGPIGNIYTSDSHGSGGIADTTSHGGYILFPVYLSNISSNNCSIDFSTNYTTEKMYSQDYLNTIGTNRYIINLSKLIRLHDTDMHYRGRGFKWEQLNSIHINDKSGNNLFIYTLHFSNSTSERLTLKGLSDSSGKYYTFSYNNIAGLSDYGGDKTDHWGYYNGQSVYEKHFTSLDNLKNTKKDSVVIGLLNRITYPTGGYTEFEWEAHQYSQVVSPDRLSVEPTIGDAGGARIREIRSYAASGGNPIKKTFYYVRGYNGSNLGSCSSSGILNGKPQYYFGVANRPATNNPSAMMSFIHGYVHGLQSYSYNVMGSHIGYSEVIEIREDNSYMKYIFSNYNTDIHGVSHFDKVGGYLGWTDTDVYRPTSNLDRERGKPLAEYTFDNNNKLLKSVVLKYRNDSARFDHCIKRVELRDEIVCFESEYLIFASAILSFASATKDFTYRYTVASKEIKEYHYNNSAKDSINVTENYTYNAMDQLSDTIQTKSIPGNLVKSYQYPYDLAPNSTFYSKMVTQNILAPVILQTTTNNNIEIERIRTDYYQDAQKTKGLILPEKVQTSVSGAANLLTDITYDLYDANGNLLQFTYREKIPTTYLWGYSKQYPIAKIENANYSDVCKKVGNGNESNGKALLETISGKAEPTTIDSTIINNLRIQLTNAMMTTYTYKPLVGITSETDPSGRTTFYEYDDAGRLNLVKDSEKNIIQQYKYHYQQQ